MHVEICTSTPISLWQLSDSVKGPLQKLMNFHPSNGSRVDDDEAEFSKSTGCKSPGGNSLPGNPLTLESLRKDQNLASSKLPFLWKLHEMLSDVERTGNDHIVSWLEHGKGFRVHRPKSFVQKVIPHYFKQSKYKSFQRQLHLYEFTRTTRGPEAGAYSHPNFVRGMRSLCLSMTPKKIKGKFRKTESSQAKELSCPQDNRYPSKVVSSCSKNALKVEALPPRNSSVLLNSIERFLVTGASLAAEIEQKSKVQEVPASSGDVVYVFDGMPFRYLEGMEAEQTPSADDLLDMEVDPSIFSL